ncbi:unnamed protein product [Rotaria socialis]|uniref:Uncharacterized protein n=1 Tax=Rotaria socialis TaxID=392032 RepID=A0A817UG10_9BILA|nr:unnamed protein product [Rotaria socialis]CAF3331030.1 unnamed protein product [Rotaria socialis]CAF3416860.1 unnamed protein product [Rotaria socialis]CAF3519056.1 unnamed protein product [Rotaria socialis]CAF3690676.1 unnamed protein product [Rotaria socialis]
MDQERAMMINLSYQKLIMPTFSVRQRRTENPLRERLLVRKFITQLETYYFYQQQAQWQYYKEQETMTLNNSQSNQQDEQMSQMDVDREIDEQNESEDETSSVIDTSVSDDEGDSVCSIVMSATDDNNNSVSLDDTSDLMKNYALMLEVPTTLTPSNGQL